MGDGAQEHTQKKARTTPRNGEVCHFLVHGDRFIHPHFIPYFVLYITMTSCSYRGECEKKIALFVTENVTINLFECKHMKWAQLHLCTLVHSQLPNRIWYCRLLGFFGLPLLSFSWRHINSYSQPHGSMANSTHPNEATIFDKTKTKLKYTDFVSRFFFFLLSIVVITVLEILNARMTEADEEPKCTWRVKNCTTKQTQRHFFPTGMMSVSCRKSMRNIASGLTSLTMQCTACFVTFKLEKVSCSSAGAFCWKKELAHPNEH